MCVDLDLASLGAVNVASIRYRVSCKVHEKFIDNGQAVEPMENVKRIDITTAYDRGAVPRDRV